MVDNVFDLTAEDYAKIVPNCRFCQFLTLIHELGLEGDEKVLDVGCGPGVLSVEMAKRLRSGNVTGLDLSENMINLSRKLASEHLLDNVSFQRGDALQLDFAPESFNVVISSYVLPWVKDPKRFLSESHRVLVKGGKLGMTSPIPDSYREFKLAFEVLAKSYPQYFPDDSPFAYVGSKIYLEDELEKVLHSVGFETKKRFVLTIQEPVTSQSYLNRINAIIGEPYLRSVPEAKKEIIRKKLQEILKNNGGELKATECALFIIAVKR